MKQLVFFSVIVLIFSCKKPENRTCFKSVGADKEVQISVGSFERLRLNSQLRYVLIQDSLDKIVVKGGENLVNHIKWSNEAGLLELSNENKCRFLRDAKKVVTVEIHFTTLRNLRYEGTEELINEGTVQTDYFTLLIRDGAGPVKLKMNAIVIDADITHGWGDYTLSGTTQVAKIGAKSNGFCDAFGLVVSDSLYVASDSGGDIKVNVNGIVLNGFLKGKGDIRYKGVPIGISFVDTGDGEVLNAN